MPKSNKFSKLISFKFFSAEDHMLGDQSSYKYLTADEMKSLGDDSLPFDVTKDERGADSTRDLLGNSFKEFILV